MIDQALALSLRLHGFRSRRARLAGPEIHYFEKRGDAGRPPLVLVHGIGSQAGHFYNVAPALSRAGHPVLALDLPGHGRSSELDRPMGPEPLYSAFRDALHAIAPERFVLYGNSLGGALSLRYACEHPERIQGLVLGSPGAGFTSPAAWDEIRELLRVEAPSDCARFLRRIYHREPAYFRILLRLFFDSITRPGVRDLLRLTRFEDLQPPEGTVVYPGPTLLLWGRSERLFPRENLEWLRSALPAHALIEEPEGIGHVTHMERPRWFSRRLLEFARGL